MTGGSRFIAGPSRAPPPVVFCVIIILLVPCLGSVWCLSPSAPAASSSSGAASRIPPPGMSSALSSFHVIWRGAARRGQGAALAGLGSAAWQVSPCARLCVRAVLRSRISNLSKFVRADSDASRCTHRVQLFRWACRLVSEVFSRL